MGQHADPAAMVRAADAGGFVRVNAAFRATLGYAEAELVERPLIDWIDPRDQDRVRAVLEGDGGTCVARHRTRDGDSVPLELRVSDEGKGVVVLGRHVVVPEVAGHDDDDDECEASVRGTLATIARIVEEQNPGYKCSILLVADGRFVRGAGPSLPEEYNAAIDGYAIGPTVGSCGTAIYWNVPIIVEDIQADPLWAPFAELAERAGVAACWSHPFTSGSGRVLGALALYSPTPRAPSSEQLSRLKAAAAMTGLAVERGRAEEALRKQRERELELEEQLRQAAKMEALGVLAGGVAHDFNNVLGTILGNAELALRMLAPETEVREMLEDIVTASRRAGSFCKQLLAYAGKGRRGSSRFDLRELVPQLSSLVQAALSKRTTLEYALHQGPTFVQGDENQLLQVIMNLVTNAADAVGDKDGRIVVASELVQCDAEMLERLAPDAELPPGQYVRLSVQDNGCGMDADVVARMFDPFFTTKFTGHGLGLAAVRGIVQRHGGAIRIESAKGEGTTVSVLLPTTAAPEETETAPQTAPPRGRKRILVADDESGLRTILRRQLEHSGYDVVDAADGQLAIDAFSEDPAAIDCVLLDLSMPKRSGAEVVRSLRAIRADVPVVLMSGYAEDSALSRFEGAPVNGFLQKPVLVDDLLETIRSATG